MLTVHAVKSFIRLICRRGRNAVSIIICISDRELNYYSSYTFS
jgi:hypothetical protein